MTIQVAAHGPAVRPVAKRREEEPSVTRPAPLAPAARVLQGRVPAQLSFSFLKRV